MNKYIYLFRHTQSTDNKFGIFSGDRRDIGLSDEGKRDAYKLKDYFRNIPIEIGISSPLKRSIETLDVILEGRTNVERIIDERIKERDYGILEGMQKRNIAMPFLGYWAKLAYRSYVTPPPGGENFRQVWIRVTPFIYDVIDLVKTRELNVAICAQNNSIRPIRAHFENKTPKQMLKENSDPGKVYRYAIPL